MKIPIVATSPTGQEINFVVRLVYINSGKYKRIVASIIESDISLFWQIQENAVGFIHNETFTFNQFTFDRQGKIPFKVSPYGHIADPLDCYKFQIPVNIKNLKEYFDLV
jgi:hypothetical protein